MCVCLCLSQCECVRANKIFCLLSLYNSHTNVCVHTHLHTHTHKQTHTHIHTNLILGSRLTHSHARLLSQKAVNPRETVPLENYVSSGASSLSAKMEPSYGSIPAGMAPTQVCLRPGTWSACLFRDGSRLGGSCSLLAASSGLETLIVLGIGWRQGHRSCKHEQWVQHRSGQFGHQWCHPHSAWSDTVIVAHSTLLKLRCCA